MISLLSAGSRAPLVRSILGLVAFTVMVHLGYQVRIGLSPLDVGPFETVLAQAVAGQIEHGPGRFYGPFEGSNHSVLMHAPLYYRLVALAAWPISMAGVNRLSAVLFVGRALSFLGTLLALWAVFSLARLDGASRRAGGLAAALVATSPILGNLAAMLRPDALGVGLQTAGAWLVLTVIRDRDTRPLRLALGTSAFALAFAAKQQNVTVAAGCALLLGLSCVSGRLRVRTVVLGGLAGLAVLATDLGLEQYLTGGRMFQSVFVYPGGAFRAINYAGWVHVWSIFDISARRSIGLLAIALVCVIALRRRVVSGPLDAALGVFLLIELAALVPLCLFNAGAAYNYALQAIVFAAVLVGRALDRLLIESETRLDRLIPISVAAMMLLMADMRLVAQIETARQAEAAVLNDLLADNRLADCPPSGRYFVERQHLNRLAGRPDLIHDDWLYGAFEQIEAADPREHWLGPALKNGPIRQVVMPGDKKTVPGLATPLPDLGYRQIARHGDLSVWERR